MAEEMGNRDAEARLRYKYKTLMQDYEELWMEVEEKRRRLSKLKCRKLQLLAEVKFLHMKLKSFVEKPSLNVHIGVKRKPPNDSWPSPSASSEETIVPKKFVAQEAQEYTNSSSQVILDLNQVPLPEGDDENFSVSVAPNGYSVDGFDNIFSEDAKLLTCRDAINRAHRVVKWRDPVVSTIHHFS